MNQKLLVSIVIPCYNHEDFIQETIKSIIAQTYQNIELIIIDDGSKDNSVTKIQEMITVCEARFNRFEFRTRANKGLSSTLNEAILWCKGEFYAALASDDIILPLKIALQVDFLRKHPDVSAIFGSVDFINDVGEIKQMPLLKEGEYTFNEIILNNCPIYAPTQLMRLDLIKDIGSYNPEILVEDWYMWLKMAGVGTVYCIEDKLALYRTHPSNTTRNYDFILKHNLKTLDLYSEHPLYQQAYFKLHWVNMAWAGQDSRLKSIKMFFKFVLKQPKSIFSKGFLIFIKYSFRRFNNWS